MFHWWLTFGSFPLWNSEQHNFKHFCTCIWAHLLRSYAGYMLKRRAAESHHMLGPVLWARAKQLCKYSEQFMCTVQGSDNLSYSTFTPNLVLSVFLTLVILMGMHCHFIGFYLSFPAKQWDWIPYVYWLFKKIFTLLLDERLKL